MRVTEADDGVSLATLQKDRAQIQQGTYKQWIDDGQIQTEKALLQNYKDANIYRNWVAVDAALTVAQTFASVQSNGVLGTGLGAGLGGTLLVGGLAAGRVGVRVPP